MGKQARLRRERMERARRLREEPGDHRVIKAYVEAAREILPTVFSPDCCLNGTRVCIEALKFHGVTASPLVVDMIVVNAVGNRMFDEHNGWPQTDEEVQRWLDRGAHVLQIDGKGNGKVGWPHHLIAEVDDVLVDSALGQASRPAKNIVLESVQAFPRGQFGRGWSEIVYDAPNGVKIGLKLCAEHHDFMLISGFQPHAGNMEVAARVAARMADIMDGR